MTEKIFPIDIWDKLETHILEDDTYEIETIKSSLMPIVDDRLVMLEVVDGKFSITGYEKYIAVLEKVTASINDYEYIEEDRQEIRKFKAQVNKLIKLFNSAIKEQEQILFSQIASQKEDIKALLGEIVEQLSIGLDESDKKFKREKEALFRKQFTDAKKVYNLPDELTYDMIAVASWLNRSQSQNAVTADIDNRLNAIKNIYESAFTPVTDVIKICQTLVETDWDTLAAIEELNEQIRLEKERKIAEAAIEEARRQEALAKEQMKNKEEETTEEIAAPPTYEALYINQKDLARAIQVLRTAQIDFRSSL